MQQHYKLTHQLAQQVVSVIQAELEASGKHAAIAVVDDHGELLAFLRTDGCQLPSITIAINKAYTAARERRDSQAIGMASREEGFPLTNFGELRYVGWGGGVPLAYAGQLVGAVGVSGLPEAEDVVLARLGADLVARQA